MVTLVNEEKERETRETEDEMVDEMAHKVVKEVPHEEKGNEIDVIKDEIEIQELIKESDIYEKDIEMPAYVMRTDDTISFLVPSSEDVSDDFSSLHFTSH